MSHRIYVWDHSVRLFHWLNVVCVAGLIGVGLVILNAKSLGVSTDGKILLKTVHVYIGYIFAFNLIWRFVWGFIGNQHARWTAILPIGKSYRHSLNRFLEGERSGKPIQFVGHNPIARLMITFLLVLMALQATTGLVLAGTDLYFPPFGHEIAEWVTNAGEDHSKLRGLKPYSKVNIDEESYKAMREFRKPFITIHVYIFYTLLAAIFVHITAVVVAEVRQKNTLISAMVTGHKVFSEKPADDTGD